MYVRPVITVQPMDVLTEEGEQVILSCLADSFPTPTYQWEMINITTMNFDTLTGESSTNLVFSSIQFEQYGRYRCRATTPIIDVNVTSDAALITGMLIHNVHVCVVLDCFNMAFTSVNCLCSIMNSLILFLVYNLLHKSSISQGQC